MTPFLKWAGGKRWLAHRLQNVISTTTGRYVEPFVGSGAVFFRVQPSRSTLSDVNARLIETYEVVRDHCGLLIEHLTEMHASHSRDFYYSVRAKKYSTKAQRAAQFIYLNRTCWNGLYRENLKGEFNVPIGTKTDVIGVKDDLISAAKALQAVELSCSDFQPVIDTTVEGDFVFADPPYTVAHNNNGFVKYNENIFSWNDQLRLRDCLLRAHNRGVRFMLTNADHQSVRELYSQWVDGETAVRSSVIAGGASHRGTTTELLVGNYSI